MKKLAVSVIAALFLQSASAGVFTSESLPIRCHKLYKQVVALQELQTDDSCADKLGGGAFEGAGEYIIGKQSSIAKRLLDIGIQELTYAKAIGCNGAKILDDSIHEAKSIKAAI